VACRKLARAVFEKLIGDGGTTEQRLRRKREDRSILDSSRERDDAALDADVRERPEPGHILAQPQTPMSNLLLSRMDKVGVHKDTFGDTTGTLEL
jgi:hypothetical protein